MKTDPEPSGVAALGPSARRARARIIEMIGNGGYGPREKLPGERDLAAAVGVSRTVVRGALSALEREGVIESSPWRGWFVAGNMTTTEGVALQSFSEMAQARGLRPGTLLLAREIRPAGLEEADALEIAPASDVLDLLRVRTLDEVPTCVDRSIVVPSRVPGIDEVDLSSGSLYAAMDTLGVHIARSDYTVSAVGAGTVEARELGVERGAPMLVGEEVGRDAAGVPLLLGRVVYRNESYRFQATLFRHPEQS
ncbi:MAG: GntR family transcriptional regulator [Nostocoides sp.]